MKSVIQYTKSVNRSYSKQYIKLRQYCVERWLIMKYKLISGNMVENTRLDPHCMVSRDENICFPFFSSFFLSSKSDSLLFESLTLNHWLLDGQKFLSASYCSRAYLIECLALFSHLFNYKKWWSFKLHMLGS